MSSRTDRPPSVPSGGGFALPRAIAVGVLHGPAELLPISSSAHVTVIPWLLGAPLDGGDAELRKAFEVVLHAATAAALLLALRDEVAEALRDRSPAQARLLLLASLPPAAAGLGLERIVERRLGTPATIAAGLIAGSVAMAWADRAPQARGIDEVTGRDALWLGIAQACALVPGVSRNGATLAAARARGVTRTDANRLSRRVALPVIGGATLLKSVRLHRRGVPAGSRSALVAGAAASFCSTLLCTRAIGLVERDRPPLPFVVYRCLLAGLVLWRLRHPDSARRSPRDARSAGRDQAGAVGGTELTAPCTTMAA